MPKSTGDWIGDAQMAYEAHEVYTLCDECNGFGAVEGVYDDAIRGPGQLVWDKCAECGGTGDNHD